ncbi:MAG: ABC transporter permease [Lachnospiraceae bacterium]|nr:ABC transporter permease [Lachnospiraceae bacterium]
MTHVMNMKQMEQKLQKADRKQSLLYLFCNFMALMIISAYSALMFSPTVQTIFPEGGDSAKQMYMIFVMTLIGCVVFTIYALGLFFRHKSGQLGILMALGASRRRLAPGLFREVLVLSSTSAVAGIVAGFPFVWIIWQGFRLILVDSSEMVLSFDLKCLFVSVLFFLLVVGFACLMAWRYLRKTNIMEVIREEHINEPVKELGRWCGPVGLVLILIGAVMGYGTPFLCDEWFHMYPPSWLSIFYAPVLVGLYMVMLHTVVHGWRSHRKNPYKNIVSRSMMKFQGRQTVNNLIVVTLLIAGACFGIFYLPANGVSAMVRYANQAYDYFYHYRADQNVPDQEAVEALAGKYGLALKDWNECEYITLGMGQVSIIQEEDSNHYTKEYVVMNKEEKVLSEDAYRVLTGQDADVEPGTYMNITDTDETSLYTNNNAREFTNMVTRKQLDTEFAGYLHNNLLSDQVGCSVLSNEDYALISEGLTDDWKGRFVQFNIDGKDNYQFANEFYYLFVNSFDKSCELPYYYDRVQKIRDNEAGEVYWGDTEDMTEVSFEKLDSFSFRVFWVYQPQFRILSQNDFLRSVAVLFMMFLFICIVCMLTALVVCYTRCQTIALNNSYIFDDLKKLGASPEFLSKEVRSQCKNVFKVPTIIGMTAIYMFFIMILYANDGRMLWAEMLALLVCLGILGLLAVIVYAVYRVSVKTIKRQLGI